MASSASTLEPDQKTTEKMTQQEESDETDSCFEFIKRRNLAVNSSPVAVAKTIEVAIEEKPSEVVPKVVQVKPIAQFSLKVSPIKPVKSSPFKQSCIDKIAENLKKLQESQQQQQPKLTGIPKVTQVAVSSHDGVALDEKLKNIKLSTKELAHQLILLRCKKLENKKIEFRTSLTGDESQK